MKARAYMPVSKSDTHLTPDEVPKVIDAIWELDWNSMFDPCPADTPFKAPCFFNGLYIDWHKWNRVNPPYGDGKKEKGDTLLAGFVRKALKELERGNCSIMLLPSKTDQDWWHWLNDGGFKTNYFNHRLKFKNNKDTATQPHFLVLIQ